MDIVYIYRHKLQVKYSHNYTFLTGFFLITNSFLKASSPYLKRKCFPTLESLIYGDIIALQSACPSTCVVAHFVRSTLK